MGRYHTLQNALMIFSVETGLSDSAARGALEQSLRHTAYRTALQRELEWAVADHALEWAKLVANKSYEVAEPESEADAREIVMRLLWSVAFPGRPLPAGGVQRPQPRG